MGTVSEMSTSRLAAPTVASIFSMSSGPGPMWRSANRSLGLGISLLRLSALPRCRHLQRCLNRTVHVPESFRGGVAPSAPRDLGALPFGVDGNPHDTTIATGRLEMSHRELAAGYFAVRPGRSPTGANPNNPGPQPGEPPQCARLNTGPGVPLREGPEGLRYPHRSPSFFDGHTLKRNSTTSSGRIR